MPSFGQSDGVPYHLPFQWHSSWSMKMRYRALA